jgi:prepilin-type N-terminal cleavage/methylation domain-containing protein
MKTRFQSRTKPSGFTLIELMVAMAITAIIVTVLVSITGVALDAWQRGRSEVRASRQAKSLLDTMAKDFESSVSRRGNDFEWLYAKVITSNLPGPASNKSSNASDLIFYTAATDRYLGEVGGSSDNGGDISCVGYHLEYQDPVKGTTDSTAPGATFVMYRLLVNPDETFSKILGKTQLTDGFSTYTPKIKEVENFVCENVYQFTLTFEVEVTQTSGTTETKVPVRVTLGENAAGKTFSIKGTGIDTDAAVGSLKPSVTDDQLKAGRVVGVEIGITVLSDSAITRLAQDGLKDEVRQKILAQESFHYSRSAVIPAM